MQNVTNELKTIYFLQVQRFSEQPKRGHQHFQETPKQKNDTGSIRTLKRRVVPQEGEPYRNWRGRGVIDERGSVWFIIGICECSVGVDFEGSVIRESHYVELERAMDREIPRPRLCLFPGINDFDILRIFLPF
jgi:hypothetical protein